MKVIFFKNDSGDESRPLFLLEDDLTDIEIYNEVSNRVGDDYDEDTNELYGEWIKYDLNELEIIKEK